MEQHFTIVSLLMPCIVFAFGLYVGIVPTEGKHNQSLKRTIFCGLGIALGLFLAFSAVAEANGDMNINQAYYYLCSISVVGWCIYAFYTSHSKLSKWRKLLKMIVYWLFTGCFLTSSSPSKDIRDFAIGLGFILPIIAYYSGLIDRTKKEKKKHVPTESRKEKAHKWMNKIHLQIGRISWVKVWIINFYKEHRKIILIVAAIIILLIILPFILRLLNAYWDYVKDYAGFDTKSYKRHR